MHLQVSTGLDASIKAHIIQIHLMFHLPMEDIYRLKTSNKIYDIRSMKWVFYLVSGILMTVCSR
jgi:hypothetical protein